MPNSLSLTKKKNETYRNMLTKVIKTAKENRYRQKIDHDKGDNIKMWQTVTYRGVKTPQNYHFLQHLKIRLFDNDNIAHQFNEYYSNVASNEVRNYQDKI